MRRRLNGIRFFLATVLLVPLNAVAQDASPLAEAVPTARVAPAEWHYTLQAPPADWAKPGFDDTEWRTGRGGFGTNGTPNLVVNTTWNTRNIWLRRKITLPASPDPATLKLVVYHDEDVEIYLDGELAARRTGFEADYVVVDLEPEAKKLLTANATRTLAIHCRQTAGGQGVDAGLAFVPRGWHVEPSHPAQPDPTPLARRGYRDAATSRPGDPSAGKALFENVSRLGCSQCHTVDGKNDLRGPDLRTVGDKFSRAELADAVLTPSAQIAVGFTTTLFRLKNGDTVAGIVKDVTPDAVTVISNEGKRVTLQAADVVREKESDVSMMPEGLERALSHDEFASLIAYLSSLRLPESAAIARLGMPNEIAEAEKPVALVPFVSEANRFNHPGWFGQIPGKPNDFLVCEHETGKIWRIEKNAGGGETKSLFADFAPEVQRGPADGLLGLAFHPKFHENRKYYIQHDRLIDRRLYAMVSEKTASPDFTHDSGQPSREIIRFACSTGDHVGGGIEFGPDGMLYIGMGDTGPQTDPQGHGQNLRLPLGKMLRIDVDRTEEGKAYAIPTDNPFRGRSDAAPEIWAYGFREPWRFSFDPITQDLWVGDVGQDRYEEVSIVRRGENHGWNVYEAFEPFSSRYRTQGATYVPPVFAYSRKFGNSITGGYVYRGEKASPFYGAYVCGDYNSKRIWALTQQDRRLKTVRQIATSPERISSFGMDERGGLYVVGYEGMVFKMNLPEAP